MILDLTRPWWDYPLVIVDFETTGVDPFTCEPVSVAAARYEHGIERASFYTLLRPKIPIPESASAIHGITDEHVRDAPELGDVAADLWRVAFDALPCGYNASHFDRVIFHRYVWGTDCPLFEPEQRWLDPLVMVRAIDRYVPGSGRHKLATTCERWGVPIPEGEAHNALADVRAVGRLLARMVEIGRVKRHVTLHRMLDYCDAKRAEQDADRERYLAKMRAKEAQRELAFDALADCAEEEPCQPT